MPQDHVTKIITVYDTIAREYADAIENYAPDLERQKFLKRIPKGGKILDVACAAGRDSFYFAEHGLKVIGIDLSEELLKIAKKRGTHVDFQKQDMRHMHFPKNSFEGIWASAALLHLKRREVTSTLRHFRDFLKPKGTLFVMVKEGNGEADVVEKLSQGLSRHFTYFQRDELKNTLTTAGFTVDQIYVENERKRQENRRDLNWISSFSKK